MLDKPDILPDWNYDPPAASEILLPETMVSQNTLSVVHK